MTPPLPDTSDAPDLAPDAGVRPLSAEALDAQSQDILDRLGRREGAAPGPLDSLPDLPATRQAWDDIEAWGNSLPVGSPIDSLQHTRSSLHARFQALNGWHTSLFVAFGVLTVWAFVVPEADPAVYGWGVLGLGLLWLVPTVVLLARAPRLEEDMAYLRYAEESANPFESMWPQLPVWPWYLRYPAALATATWAWRGLVPDRPTSWVAGVLALAIALHLLRTRGWLAAAAVVYALGGAYLFAALPPAAMGAAFAGGVVLVVWLMLKTPSMPLGPPVGPRDFWDWLTVEGVVVGVVLGMLTSHRFFERGEWLAYGVLLAATVLAANIQARVFRDALGRR